MDNDKQIFIKGIEVASKEYAQSSFEAAKQYADDKDLILKNELETEIEDLEDNFFDGSEEEWNLLTPQQQQTFLFAAVGDSYVDLTPEDESNLNDIVGGEDNIQSDMNEEDANALASLIANGV